jgi:hypothetical protein
VVPSRVRALESQSIAAPSALRRTFSPCSWYLGGGAQGEGRWDEWSGGSGEGLAITSSALLTTYRTRNRCLPHPNPTPRVATAVTESQTPTPRAPSRAP